MDLLYPLKAIEVLSFTKKLVEMKKKRLRIVYVNKERDRNHRINYSLIIIYWYLHLCCFLETSIPSFLRQPILFLPLPFPTMELLAAFMSMSLCYQIINCFQKIMLLNYYTIYRCSKPFLEFKTNLD